MNVDDLPAALLPTYQLLASGAAAILPPDGLAERLATADREGRPLRVKLGIDPSGAELTLGHAVVLRKLRQFQDHGHTAVLVVGGFTGQVGDPSGKTTTRAAQSPEDVIAHSRGYFDQVMQILQPDRTEVVNNAEWLSNMVLGDLLGYTRQVTVAQLLERDDFAKRYARHAPISLSEFFYPLLQGIDSVAIRADIELGGTDQTFNNLIGRELQRGVGQQPQAVLTVPLLVGTDGVEKMGKSLDNYVALTEPAASQFGKLMSIPDTVVGSYAELAAAMSPDEVAAVAAEIDSGGGRANQAKRRVARQVVSLYHGTDAAIQAEAAFDAIFKSHELPTDAPTFVLPASLIAAGRVHLPALLAAAGLAASSSAGRRDVDAGAVRIDGTVVPARDYDVALSSVDGRILAIGKRRSVRVVYTDQTPYEQGSIPV